jgi:hypothetical protein
MPFTFTLIVIFILGLWLCGLIKGNEIACDWFGKKGSWFPIIYIILSALIADGIFNLLR